MIERDEERPDPSAGDEPQEGGGDSMEGDSNVAEASDQANNEAAESEESPPQGASEPLRAATPEESSEAAKEFVDGLLKAMGLEAEVAVETEPDRALIDVTGENLGLLIGRRGQTLDALQELVRAAVQRRLRARVRLLVDVEGYRARRRTSLAEYARAMATRAQERGTEIELEAMNSYERKIVHDALAEVEGATSFSEGEEPDRKVIVRGE
ncbi:MAG TPA: RNA-binding cell elongation regulator Jag/EloR [Actinomycetota bacterium]|nr:RNA-binding cell elongation regulator Jag/EloR [Actinomycetota bacterium]